MKTKDLIAYLQNCPPDNEIEIISADFGAGSDLSKPLNIIIHLSDINIIQLGSGELCCETSKSIHV